VESPFTIIVGHIREFKSFLKMIMRSSTFSEDFHVEVSEEGMRIHELDRSHITFLDLLFPPKFFDKYQCNEATVLKLNRYDLLWVLDGFDEEEDLLELSMNGEKLQARTLEAIHERRFEISQVDLEYAPPSLPDVEYPINLKIALRQLIKIVENSQGVGGSLKLKYQFNRLYFCIIGETQKYYGKTFAAEKNGASKCYKSNYSIERFKPLLKLCEDNKFLPDIIGDIYIQFDDDSPITIKTEPYPDCPSFMLMIAPRIEAEE
jgi:hypothetical protein